ncbi:MAG: hypothetical protein IPL53_18560 [Ignavibacteria bacterium]|nr:hypothetical protein [Ignavibacteria bacterium]
MSSFGSFVKGRDVNLYWSSEGEINNLRFEVERSDVKGQMSNEWTKIGSVAGNGTTSYQNSYTFTDRGLSTGTYNYRLKQIDINGNFEYFNLMNEINIGIPVKYDLSQNYPNPFNPVTKINFDLPSDAMTVLRIFDASGREVSTPVNEVRTAGYHSVIFNASGMSSGVTFIPHPQETLYQQRRKLLVK